MSDKTKAKKPKPTYAEACEKATQVGWGELQKLSAKKTETNPKKFKRFWIRLFGGILCVALSARAPGAAPRVFRAESPPMADRWFCGLFCAPRGAGGRLVP